MKVVVLKGGLGNQLFQLCLYLELINQENREKIFIDNKTGFLLDFKFKRNFELKQAIHKKEINSKFNSLLNIFLIISKKFYLKRLFEAFNFKIIDDNEYYIYQKNSSIKKKQKYLLFNGYYHNFKIVDKNISELIDYIKPYLLNKVDNKFEALYKKILSEKNSVAICIRFYEESKDPTVYAFEGKIIKVSRFNDVIKEIEKKLKNPHFFIFVQSQNKFLEKLVINSESTLISPNNGYVGTWETLRAQSYCKHHLFNNSSFYFWGAILSKYRNKHEDVEQLIYASNNFLFREIYNPNWQIF